MSSMAPTALPGWALPISLAAHLLAGTGLGLLYFGSLWWNAQLFERSGRLGTVLALVAARFALLAGALILVSLEGAMPLLVTALGVFIARIAVLRRTREVAA